MPVSPVGRGLGLLLLAFLMTRPVAAQERPIAVDKTERSQVRLVLLDTLVVDRKGDPVPGLALDDFELTADGDLMAIDTFDVSCSTLEAEPTGEAPPRKIVLLFDYQHLPGLEREAALGAAMRLARRGETGQDEIMVAAMTGGLRIEQDFTRDPEQVHLTLKRMQYDITLWNGNYSHMSENGFVASLETLFAVLASEPGPKAVVLFSAMEDVPLDLEFERLAAMAATTRSSLYPVDTRGLMSDKMVGGPSIAPG